MFPGCVIEQKWNIASARKRAAQYALLIMYYSPEMIEDVGVKGFVKFAIEGSSYAIHKTNFKYINEIVHRASQYMTVQNLSLAKIASNPKDTIDTYLMLSVITNQMTEIDKNLTRFMWLTPGRDASCHYRSLLPSLFMQESMQDKFYVERAEYTNQESIFWNDVFILHRTPNDMTYSVIRAYKKTGKVLIYEWDDDFFSVPEWNHNAKHFTNEVLDKIRNVMEESDFIFGSTEMLCNIYPEKSFLCPNLINFNEFPFISKHLPYPKQFHGFFWHQEDERGKYSLVRKINGSTELTMDVSEPASQLPVVRVLWAGSNTHDRDLSQVVSSVKAIGESCGIAIQFIFFGYCPTEFMEAYTQPGNTKTELAVREEFISYVNYVPAVKHDAYKEMLKKIAPHIALCPLDNDSFNYSKSNLKLLEMGAMGIPVLCSDIGQFGPYDCLKEDFPELLIPSNDSEAWTAGILKFAKSMEERVSTGNSLRKWIYDNYSWQTDNLNRAKWVTAFDAVHQKVTHNKNVHPQPIES